MGHADESDDEDGDPYCTDWENSRQLDNDDEFEDGLDSGEAVNGRWAM